MPKRRYGSIQEDITQRRRRAYAACTECRRRKRKCDGQRPCSSCHGYGYRCNYDAGAAATDSAAAGVEGEGKDNGSDTVAGPGHSLAKPESERSFRVTDDLPAGSSANADGALPTEFLVSKQKGRFVSAHSAVALPHLVGAGLGAAVPPRLHSFAWNLGTRTERPWTINNKLSSIMTLEAIWSLISIYFETIHPMFPFLCQTTFFARISRHWHELESQPNFAAVVALTAALGSYFTAPSHPMESALIEYSFSILDQGLSTMISLVDLDSVAGWILRTVFLRLTTRPTMSCLASQTAIHMAEVLSLHRDISGRGGINGSPRKALFSEEERETRGRHYWVARCLNCLISIDYGLTPVKMSRSTCPEPKHSSKTHMQHLMSLAQIASASETETEEGPNSQVLSGQIAQLQAIPCTSPTVCLFTSEVCLSLLRRYIAASLRPSLASSRGCAAILKKGLESIRGLWHAGQLWWNLLSVPFQTVCVVVHFDTDIFVGLLAQAMESLQWISEQLNTHLAEEALNTARQLVKLSMESTETKAKLKHAALGDSRQVTSDSWPSLDPLLDFEVWPLGLDFAYEDT
ncbi:Gal4p family of zinc cluster protein [Moelleriella libera RCEF 2490]|uniref:Gal4p family of zinc cluster protein n=1 Tax=Moelleriella libera RCEF 2490 TaxID=1081109 RepID=A0A162I963_9HYPO|nr:Gal4p family of zinc cluster protein [Moelleriella libera RCEF 2490]